MVASGRASGSPGKVSEMPAVKIGASRQVVIPKRIYDQLGLAPGDYLEVELNDGRLTFTPKTLVDEPRAAQPARGAAADAEQEAARPQNRPLV